MLRNRQSIAESSDVTTAASGINFNLKNGDITHDILNADATFLQRTFGSYCISATTSVLLVTFLPKLSTYNFYITASLDTSMVNLTA